MKNVNKNKRKVDKEKTKKKKISRTEHNFSNVMAHYGLGILGLALDTGNFSIQMVGYEV